MKKIVLSLLMCVLLAACGDNSGTDVDTAAGSKDKETVSIGVIIPLSGEVANVGEGFKNAVSLAEEDLKQKDTRYQYRILIEDDAFEAKKTISAFHKLNNADGIDAVISFSTQGGGVISPLAEKAEVIHINIGASEAKIAEGKYNFIHWTLPDLTSRRLLDFYRSRGYRKVAMVNPYNSGSLAIEEALMKMAAENYPEMELKSFHIQPNEKDFRLLLNKIRQSSPDVVLALVYGNTAFPFIKQYKEAGMPYPLTNSETFAILGDLSVAEGAYYSDVAETEPQLTERYKKSFPGSSTFAVGNAYDSVMLLVKAFEQAENKAEAVDELAAVKQYDGKVGRLSQSSEGIFNSQAVLKKVINGQSVATED